MPFYTFRCTPVDAINVNGLEGSLKDSSDVKMLYIHEKKMKAKKLCRDRGSFHFVNDPIVILPLSFSLRSCLIIELFLLISL